MSEFFDVHTHVGEQINDLFNEPELFPRKETLTQLIQKYDERIDKIVTFPMPGTVYFNYSGIDLVENGQAISSFPYEEENRALVEAVDKHDVNNRIIPFACIHPKLKLTEQLNELSRLSENSRLLGIKFHTLDTRCTVDDFFNSEELVSFCAEKKMPVLIHSANFNGPENCINVFKWARQFPSINICVAHLMNFSKDFFEQLLAYDQDNLFTDVSPFLGLCQMIKRTQHIGSFLDLPYETPKEVLTMLFNHYAKFLLWGSDEPFGKFKISDNDYASNSLEAELDFLYSLEPVVREKIAGENSKRFLSPR